MNAVRSSIITEEELRLRMDRRTVAQQEAEIRHLRMKLERLSAKGSMPAIADGKTDRTGASLAA